MCILSVSVYLDHYQTVDAARNGTVAGFRYGGGGGGGAEGGKVRKGGMCHFCQKWTYELLGIIYLEENVALGMGI